MYSDGLFPSHVNLAAIKQAKSSKYWAGGLKINFDSYDTQIPGLTTAHRLGSNIGLRQVKKNGLSLVEGLDFHVTHGACSVTIDGQNKKYIESHLDFNSTSTPGFNEQYQPCHLTYDKVEEDENGFSQIALIDQIYANPDSLDYEEWTLECLSTGMSLTDVLSFDYSTGESSYSLWQIQHRLNSKDLFIQCFTEVDGLLSPIFPKKIEFLSDDVINVTFSKNVKGKAKIIKLNESPSTYSITVDTPASVWEVPHNLATSDVIFSVYAYVNGQLAPIEKINPKKIELVDDNLAKVYFSKPLAGKVIAGAIKSYSTASFEQTFESSTWSFTNNLGSDLGVFQVMKSDGTIIFPKQVLISSDYITVKFSRPVSGKLIFAKVFNSKYQNTIFSVTGSETGLNGFARVGLKYKSSKIEFIITPQNDAVQFYVGQKFVLTPANKITTHKSYTDIEKWSFIKVNPIATGRPKFAKTGSSKIVDFGFKHNAVRPQIITAKFNGSSFDISSSIDGFIGQFTFGQIVDTSEFSFKIINGSLNVNIDDYFSIDIKNPEPILNGFDLTLGYDVDITVNALTYPFKNLAGFSGVVSYDVVEYDDRIFDFDLSQLNIRITNKGIENCYFELKFNGTHFTVKKYNNKNERVLLTQYPSILPGQNYSCPDFDISIPSNIDYIGSNEDDDSYGDLIVFSVDNPPPFADTYDFNLISSKFGNIALYPKSFIDSPSTTWIIRFINETTFEVTDVNQYDPLCGTQLGSVSRSFDNGFVHFLITPGLVGFTADDTFAVSIQEHKPSYLIHNEITGFSKPLIVGKWYWNGKIGLKVDIPKYVANERRLITREKTFKDAQNNLVTVQWDEEIDDLKQVKVGQKLAILTPRTGEDSPHITFSKAPRYDAVSDVYLLNLLPTKIANSNGENDQFFDVYSHMFGHQRGAKLNALYVDDSKPEMSRDVQGHYDGTVEFTITSGNEVYSATTIDFSEVVPANIMQQVKSGTIFVNSLTGKSYMFIGENGKGRYSPIYNCESLKQVYSQYHDILGLDVITAAAQEKTKYPSFTFSVRSDDFPLYYANNLIIFESLTSQDNIYLERVGNDRICLSSNSDSPELMFSPINENLNNVEDTISKNTRNIIPTYTKPNLNFSDESSNLDIFLSLTDEKLGSIENPVGSVGLYSFTADSTFFFKHLPFNTRLGIRVIQDEQENEFVDVRITEKIKAFDLLSFTDLSNVSVEENHFTRLIVPNDVRFRDVMNVRVFDNNFRGFYSGYDTTPYEIEPQHFSSLEAADGAIHNIDSYYDDSEGIQTSNFGIVAGGVTLDQNNNVIDGFGGQGMWVHDKGNTSTARSSISEVMTMYSRLTDDLFDYADPYAVDGLPVESAGWTNANVIDGLPVVDEYGWTNAEFNVQYGQIEINPQVQFELIAYVNKLGLPSSAELINSVYANMVCALINVDRKISTATIMTRGLSVNSILMFETIESGIQIPFSIIEQNSDFIKINLATPSTGKIIIF